MLSGLFPFLVVTFLLASLIQLGYWLFLFSRLAFYEEPEVEQTEPKPVSIIICVRNESENLKKNLDRILSQSYRSLEIIVVNDQSTDDSEKIILELQKNYPNLTLISNYAKELPGKKQALTKGIEAATNEILLLTDADCFPATNQWVSIMQSKLHPPVAIGLGYSPYLKQSGFLNQFIRFEAVYTAIQYFSFALAGQPYMGVGRNLIYTRSIFERTGGFDRHQEITSGDDDLFINEAAQKDNIAVILDPKAFVYSTPKDTWSGYYYQKRRHLSTARHYRPFHQLMLGLLSWSHLWHYLGGLLLLLFPDVLLLVTITFMVRLGVVSFMYWHILQKLKAFDLWWFIPLLDAVFCWYYVLFVPVLITTGNKSSWT